MQRVLQMLETRDSVHVAELSEAFSVSEVTVRNDLSELARQGLVARVRGGVRPVAAQSVRARFRLPAAARRTGEAGDRAGGRGDGRRGRGGRARREHHGVLPRARAALQAGARRRHERDARGGLARRRARASTCSSPAASCASPRCRSSATSAPSCCARLASSGASSARAASASSAASWISTRTRCGSSRRWPTPASGSSASPTGRSGSGARSSRSCRRTGCTGSSPTRARPWIRSKPGARAASRSSSRRSSRERARADRSSIDLRPRPPHRGA